MLFKYPFPSLDFQLLCTYAPRSAPTTRPSSCLSRTWPPTWTTTLKKSFLLNHFWTDFPKTTSTLELTGSRTKNWEWSGWTESRTQVRPQNAAQTERFGTATRFLILNNETDGSSSKSRFTGHPMIQHFCRFYQIQIQRTAWGSDNAK